MALVDTSTGEVVLRDASTGPLAALEHARRLLAEATSVDTVKDLRDQVNRIQRKDAA